MIITLHLFSNGPIPSINCFYLSTQKLYHHHHHHHHSLYHNYHLSSSPSSSLSILIDTKPKEIDLKKLPDAIDEAVYVHEKFAIGMYMYSILIHVYIFRSNPLWVVWIFH